MVYEEVFKKHYFVRKTRHHQPGILTLFLLCALTISFLFWGLGFTSFYASSLAQILIAVLILYYRHDLFWNAFASAILMVVISISFYYSIEVFSPGWIEATYQFENLSGIKIVGVPVEEFVFWFLFGFIIGPLYEYWKGEQLRRL